MDSAMKNVLFLFALLLGLAACTPAAATPTSTAAHPTETPVPSLTDTPTSTVTPTITPTATPVLPEINPYQPSSLWPAEVQARFKDVLANPWTATDTEKADFDQYLITQWQLTLQDEGVPNAEILQGYDLLNAIIEHQKPIVLTGTETQDQLESYLVELPFSLHELIRSDKANNLVPMHHEDGKYVAGFIYPDSNPAPSQYTGPLQKSPGDWGYAMGSYGLGMNDSPRPDYHHLLEFAGWFAANQSFYGEPLDAPAVTMGDTSGDLVFLFHLPGIDPSQAVGAMIRMDNGNTPGYTEEFVPISGNKTTSNDACSVFIVGKHVTDDFCPGGVVIKPADMTIVDVGYPPVTLKLLLKLMSKYPSLYVQVSTNAYNGNPMWKDSTAVVSRIIPPPSIGKDFFNSP
jgi:hypothetical protein